MALRLVVTEMLAGKACGRSQAEAGAEAEEEDKREEQEQEQKQILLEFMLPGYILSARLISSSCGVMLTSAFDFHIFSSSR
ncbi:hypothetical protein AWZ03_002841 [Drosophila navojoa]|uniref:Uncharacterized protein n=1 Tax=Drosophila navojoa TaxID=7232 RepID=A0A484BRL1_DRONA|nr:hypothetical protein AWZ03_002841 [Drosophila navojoa]